MTIDEFVDISATRILTPVEFVQFAEGQDWRIVVKDDGKASLKVKPEETTDPLAVALAKMMSREPYRTNVIQVVREMEPAKKKVLPTYEPEATTCKECKGTWYCSLAEIREAVQSPHYCGAARCPYREAPRRNGS